MDMGYFADYTSVSNLYQIKQEFGLGPSHTEVWCQEKWDDEIMPG